MTDPSTVIIIVVAVAVTIHFTNRRNGEGKMTKLFARKKRKKKVKPAGKKVEMKIRFFFALSFILLIKSLVFNCGLYINGHGAMSEILLFCRIINNQGF